MGFGKAWFLPIFVFVRVDSVPPDACFANFRWDDCGKPPVPVMYYWKPGSRCEVGLWRGCLPNINMFTDEYECINTCIFSARAGPQDYHALNEESDVTGFDVDVTETEDIDQSTTDEVGGSTTGEDSTGATTEPSIDPVTDENKTTGSTEGGQTTDGGDNKTTSGGDAAETTAPPAPE